MKPHPDTKALDGVLAECWRLVRPGGRIKYDKEWWQDHALKQYTGDYVYVSADYWRTELSVFHPVPRLFQDPLLVTIRKTLRKQ